MLSEYVRNCKIFAVNRYRDLCKRYFPKKYADILFSDKFGYRIDWRNPRDLNEMINYLAFSKHAKEWPLYADKYSVRNYITSKGLESILVPLYGHWNRIEDIDFDSLPEEYVLKANNGSGDVFIVRDANSLNKRKVLDHFNQALSGYFGLESAEPHYLKIRPQIIAEKLLVSKLGMPIVDYKVWCFDGKPYCIFTASLRDYSTHDAKFSVYDLDWVRQDCNITESYRNDVEVLKPVNLEEMLKYAKIISHGIPQVRVDFYEVDGKIYFGEMTMTSACGRMDYFTPAFLKDMRNQIHSVFPK